MQIKHLSVLAALATAAVSTSIKAIIEPQPAPRDDANNTTIATRSAGNPGVYWCTLRDWQGLCDWIALPDLASGMYWEPGWQGSIGPDHGVVCQLYEDTSCQGTSVGGISYPGIADVADNYNLHAQLSEPKCLKCQSD